jgi:hypothetical protein
MYCKLLWQQNIQYNKKRYYSVQSRSNIDHGYCRFVIIIMIIHRSAVHYKKIMFFYFFILHV